MHSRLGAFISEQRRARPLTPQQLAAAIGYKNLAKGANRILTLERAGETAGDLLDKLIAVLALDREHVHALADDDRRAFIEAWEAWASEPVAPEMRYRVMPAIWCRAPVPDGLSREEAAAFASARAVDSGWAHVLIWSRREEVWCYPDGRVGVMMMKVGEVAGPILRLRGRGNRGFTFE